MEIEISQELQRKCPDVRLGCILAEVAVKPSGDELLKIMEEEALRISRSLEIEQISRQEKIHSTRETYKALGKKPGRYRPSAEALLRRVVGGKGLYHVNNVVDWLNCVSIRSGYSIGGYDAEKIQGKAVLGIGREGEPYEAIARGELNIAGLPLFRDHLGAFGTPTSDSVRTMVTENTRTFLMVIFDFGWHDDLEEVMKDAKEGLTRYCGGKIVKDWRGGQ